MRLLTLLVLAAVSWAACVARAQTPDVTLATIEGRCTRVVDGDTLRLSGGETVRLLGIDAPELGTPYADEARWLLYEWVVRRPLRLELDRQHRDIYGRLLAHIYVEREEGWVLVNAELVRAGLARLLFIPPNARYYDYFADALEEAQLQRRGLWGTVGGHLTICELEEDLLTYITEMVTVEFTVAELTSTSRHIVLHAAQSEYGFYVKIPSDVLDLMDWTPSNDLIGTCVLATGILTCERVGLAPCIVLDYPAQLQMPVSTDE
jgi:micrococcal nuclease